jgi:hypothetical protein
MKTEKKHTLKLKQHMSSKECFLSTLQVLYAGMERVGPWASLYFLLLMVFGNYVLFSLLVAILVEGFSETAHEPSGASLVLSVNTHYHAILGEIANIPESEPLTLATIRALPTTSSASTPKCKFYKEFCHAQLLIE